MPITKKLYAMLEQLKKLMKDDHDGGNSDYQSGNYYLDSDDSF
jgi:hypothetical protein